jgi:hypothetical protein
LRVHLVLRRLRWLAGIVWVLSWLELYLEVFRFGHVRPPAFLSRFAPLQQFRPNAHAGGWLRADLAFAAIAPVAFLVLVAATSLQTSASPVAVPAPAGSRRSIAAGLLSVGALVVVLGTINQFIGRAPFTTDLTLRRGNGGFVVIGFGCLIGGVALARRRTSTVVAPDV